MLKRRKPESNAINWKNRYQETLDHLKDGPVKVYKPILSDKPLKPYP